MNNIDCKTDTPDPHPIDHGNLEQFKIQFQEAASSLHRGWATMLAGGVQYLLWIADTKGSGQGPVARPAEAGQHMKQAARSTVRARQFDRTADVLHNTLSLYSEAGA